MRWKIMRMYGSAWGLPFVAGIACGCSNPSSQLTEPQQQQAAHEAAAPTAANSPLLTAGMYRVVSHRASDRDCQQATLAVRDGTSFFHLVPPGTDPTSFFFPCRDSHHCASEARPYWIASLREGKYRGSQMVSHDGRSEAHAFLLEALSKNTIRIQHKVMQMGMTTAPNSLPRDGFTPIQLRCIHHELITAQLVDSSQPSQYKE